MKYNKKRAMKKFTIKSGIVIYGFYNGGCVHTLFGNLKVKKDNILSQKTIKEKSFVEIKDRYYEW